jgi:oligoribonuclease (3'-5' exoribonuclease)
MKRFLDGMDQENPKTQGGKGQITKIQKKTRRKKRRKEKEEILSFLTTYMEVPILMCSPSVGNTLRLLPSCDPPSAEPTRMGTSPTI